MTLTPDAYLAELERLLANADPVTRQELVDGIREELAGLSPEEADARLRELGDPAYVAVGMLAETRDAAPAPARAAEQDGDAAWYPVVTVLLLTVGGVIVPVLGWIVGLIMLWAARGWRTLHKVAGTVIALLGPGMLLAGLVATGTTQVTQVNPAGGGDSPNPLIPPMVEAPFPTWWMLAIVVLVVWIAGWIWLLVAHRARR